MNNELTLNMHKAYIDADKKTLDELWIQLSNFQLIKFYSGKYENGTNYNLNSLKSHTLWMSSPHQFNDPFDCAMNIDYSTEVLQNVQQYYHQIYGIENILDIIPPDIKNIISQQGSAIIKQLLSSHNKKVEDSIFVSCFSEASNLNSLRMWGHYANNHSGFCCEYSFTDIKNSCPSGCLPIKYSDTIQIDDRGKSPKEHTEYILNLAYTKASEWSYEQEWRILATPDEHHGKAGYSIPFPLPQKIYMGCKANESLKQELIQFCKKEKIRLYQMEMVPGTYKLLPIEVQMS